VGTTAGATAGTFIMNRLHTAWLKWLLAILMVYLAYEMLAKGLDAGFHMHLPSFA
jgi:uncharacterized membrane protein YfcA